MNVLVIEDDKRIAALVERALIGDGHRVTLSHDGREGTDLILASRYDAVLLDILLPGMDGFKVLEHVRSRHCKTPILMLTAVDAVPRIVHAFDLGADDYLVKPFILEILLARVSAIARRAGAAEAAVLVSAGGITLDRSRRVAIRNGRHIPLTRKQFELLETLMRRAGLITSREQLIEDCPITDAFGLSGSAELRGNLKSTL
jgi:DNA-binding response OmpR family regulator